MDFSLVHWSIKCCSIQMGAEFFSSALTIVIQMSSTPSDIHVPNDTADSTMNEMIKLPVESYNAPV